MNRTWRFAPSAIVLTAIIALIAVGPIRQFPDYHHFADQRAWLGIPNAADVLSNLPFALVGAWGWLRLRRRRSDAAIAAAWPGYRLFLLALLLTAIGSAFYHWAPSDGRLVWDRIPIALASAGLLAGVRADVDAEFPGARVAMILALFGVASVLWWYASGTQGQGDLRPYLLLQALPLVLVPLWQAIYRAPRADRIAFAAAIALYVAAKACELFDHPLLTHLHWISGHTLKHLLAAAGAGVIVARFVHRLDAASEEALDEDAGCNRSLKDLWDLYRFRAPANFH
jgi:hypothetical protein